jgi:hypothetical protein
MTQNELIAEHLEEGNTITALEALRDFGCFRLASRICDIKNTGVPVQSRWKTITARRTGEQVKIKEYYL